MKIPFVCQYCKEIGNIHVCTFRLETNDVSLRPLHVRVQHDLPGHNAGA